MRTSYILVIAILTACLISCGNAAAGLFDDLYYAKSKEDGAGKLLSINIEKTENGTIETDYKRAKPKTKVTFTIKPDKGYRLQENSLTLNETAIDETSSKTFVMPETDVTLKAVFRKIEPDEYGYQDVVRADSASIAMIYVPVKNDIPYNVAIEAADLKKNFWLSQTEVTFSMWRTVKEWAISFRRGSKKYRFENAEPELFFRKKNNILGNENSSDGASFARDDVPVVMVSCFDAILWCNAFTEYLNNKHNLNYKTVYNAAGGEPVRSYTQLKNISEENFVDASANGFRLPSSYEWIRSAGWRNDKVANVVDNTTAHPWFLKSSLASGMVTETLYDIADQPDANPKTQTKAKTQDKTGSAATTETTTAAATVTAESNAASAATPTEANSNTAAESTQSESSANAAGTAAATEPNAETSGAATRNANTEEQFVSLKKVAWFFQNSGAEYRPVAQKTANDLNFYDMSGNVWEWCLDISKISSKIISSIRGGSFNSKPSEINIESMQPKEPADKDKFTGFRIARNAE